MGGTAVRFILLSALAVALAACTSDPKQDQVEPNIFPSNYKQEILDTLKNTLVDPTNVREAFVSDPFLTPGSKDQRYAVCLRYNGRNLNRQYDGSVVRIAFFFGGRLNQLIETKQDQCAKAAYKPFPELEKLCLAKSCD